jgi:hypothetical protein
MSRRHIFFKLSSDAGRFTDVRTFAELELVRYVNDLRPVGNVFELLKIPDLARLIDRDPEIQHLITSALPAVQHHGYLATVSPELSVEPLFRALNFIDEIFIFQRSHLPRDVFISTLIAKGLLQRYEVYNWHVFHGKCMPYYLRILQANRPVLRNSDAIERFVKNINLQPSPVDQSLMDWEPEPFFSDNGFFSFASNRPQKALVNWLTTGGKALLDLSPGSGSTLQYASMRGLSATGIAESALQAFLCNSKSFYYDIPLHLIAEAIQKLSERLMQLTDARLTRQVDLFLVDLGKEYLLYRTKQLIARKKPMRERRSIDKELFLMSRFLIDQNFITHNRDLNQFLMFVLVKTVLHPKTMNNLHGFLSSFKANANEIYLDLFALHRFTNLFGMKPEKTITLLNERFYLKEILDPRREYGVMVNLLPCKKPAVDTVHSWLQEQFGMTHVPVVSDDINMPDESSFGVYAREKLDFLKSFLKYEDYRPYVMNCQKSYHLLSAIRSSRSNIRRVAITAANTVFHIDEKPHMISYARVIEEMLDNNFPQLKATIYKKISLPMIQRNNCQYEILLLEVR